MSLSVQTRLAPVFACAALAAATFLVPPALRAQEGSSSRPASASAIAPSQETPALAPLELKVAPTITCIGIQWKVNGDTNSNATGAVEFRPQGAAQWSKAFDLRRVPRRGGAGGSSGRRGGGGGSYVQNRYAMNYLAGSIFDLKPGTQYDLKVTLTDPDGGGASKTVAVTTRTVPAIPKTGNVIEVKGGGDALKKALESAKAGDIFNVHAGTYEGGCVVSEGGTAEKPIVIRAAGDGEALLLGGEGPKSEVWLQGAKSKLDGIRVKGPYVMIEGLSFYNFLNCVFGEREASDLSVTRCRMNHFFTGIFVLGDRGYYADNVIRESFNALDESIAPGMRNEGHGMWVHPGSNGTVCCYNEISLVADGFRMYGDNCDVYGNDVIFNVDDGIEVDYGGPNLRVMDNRWSFTGQNGLSFQPYIGGPAYMIRNLVIGAKENTIKNRYNAEGAVFINNTLVSFETQANDLLIGTYSRNNLFLEIPGKGKPSARVDTSPDRLARLDMDYDGFGDSGPNGMSVSNFAAKTGLEKHGVQFASNDEVFAHPPGKFEQYQSKQWSIPEAFMTEKGRPHPDLSLKAGSRAIGAGVAVPNITRSAPGKAPDLGALPFGQPIPHYGPR